jgi:biotin operon repressor
VLRDQPLFDDLSPAFDGDTIDDALDTHRLRRQLDAVRTLLLARYSWHSLAEISQATGTPEASASARLRDLRKEKFGGYTIERRRRSPGTFEYRLVRPCVVQNW